jgi:transposase
LLGNRPFSGYADSTLVLALDPNQLPKDVDLLHKIVVELCERLKHETSEKDKYRSLLRELLEAQRNRKSEQLSKEQLALFETLWKAGHPEEPAPEPQVEPDAERVVEEEQKPEESQSKKRSGRQPLARHLVRERVVHDLAESEKHCNGCGKDLHLLGEEISERYEFVPAVMKVIVDVRLKYACDCTVKTAEKPAQPIEKSTAGASVLAQVIVSKFADHQPLHRQEKIFARHGVEISRKTMGGWMPAAAGLLEPLYQAAKKVLFES